MTALRPTVSSCGHNLCTTCVRAKKIIPLFFSSYVRRRRVFEFPPRNCDETIVGWAQLTLELQSSIIMREWIVSTAVVCQKRIGNKIMHERYIEEKKKPFIISYLWRQNYCNNDKSNYTFELAGSSSNNIFIRAIVFFLRISFHYSCKASSLWLVPHIRSQRFI